MVNGIIEINPDEKLSFFAFQIMNITPAASKSTAHIISITVPAADDILTLLPITRYISGSKSENICANIGSTLRVSTAMTTAVTASIIRGETTALRIFSPS